MYFYLHLQPKTKTSMNRRLFSLLTAFILTATIAVAQGPNNSGTYYEDANGKKGEALKTALYNIIKNKKKSPSYDDLLELYKITDTRPDGKVRDWYSNATSFTHIKDKAGSYKKEGDVYNREHTVPQSWGPPKADIVHVVPADGYVNNRRSNLPLGEVGTATYESANGYSKLGSCKTSGYSGTVFEPNDEVKGDLARIYFYMATCYEDNAKNWSGVFGGTKYQPMQKWAFDMMVRWSKLDPVDEVEIARNNAIARSDVQGNRNPFVDYPGLEDYVWGSKKEEAFSYDNYTGGGDTPIVTVAAPTFTPGEGTFDESVEVSMSTTTAGATIYYTTDLTEPTTSSKVYESPITITTTTTLKAIAVKDDISSYQTIATYTITTGGTGGESPVEGLIALNSTLFDISGGPTFNGNITDDFVGTENGVTITYSLGTGGNNRYCSSSQIRLYQKNRLTIAVASGTITGLEFQLASETSKKLSASTGSVSGVTWTGNAQSVTFNVNDGSGNMQLSGVKVTLSNATGIDGIVEKGKSEASIYTLSGQRLRGSKPMKSGVFVREGKKIVLRR